MFLSSPLSRYGAASCILIAALVHLGNASLGVVDIHNLLEPNNNQQPLSSDTLHSQESIKHHPWTHRPQCAHSTSFKNLGTKYCVYTNKDAFINGISILSTPKTAEQALKYLDEEPLSYFFSQDQVDDWFNTPRPWKIVDIPGKDKGVVATRRIKKYETFMVDQATVVMDLEMEKAVAAKDNLRLLKLGVDQLRSPEFVRMLSKKHSGAEEGEDEEEEGVVDEHVMMTNAFGTQLGEVSFRGLYPLVSRINHACDPNAFVMFSNSGFSLGIKAYRDIEPGEEITISYLLLGKPYQPRQEGLQRWGFNCTCSLCSLPDPARTLSDTRRARIEAAEPELLAHWREGRHQAAIRIAEEVVELMKEEGLTPLLTDEYVILARLYLLRGDRETAEEYSDLALELLDELGFLGSQGREDWGLERLLGEFADRGSYM